MFIDSLSVFLQNYFLIGRKLQKKNMKTKQKETKKNIFFQNFVN